MRVTPDRRVPPSLGPVRPPAVPQIQRERLAGGLPLLFVERRGLPIVSVQVVVRGGAAADPPGLEGLAALTASTLDEGTASFEGARIAAELALLGASFRAIADWHETLLSLHVLAPNLRPALMLLADIARRPVFPEPAVGRRRGQRIAALLQDREEPAGTASRALARAIYDGHRYGTGPAGTPESVARLTREHLADAHARAFTPAGAFLAAAGDATVPSLRPILDDVFGDWAGGDTTADGELPLLGIGEPVVHLVDRPGAPQSELRVGHAGPPRATPDYFPLIVGNTILGGAFTSRINSVLREQKGLTYGARTGFAFRRSGGAFGAGVAIQTDATAEAVQDILAAMAGLREAPPSEPELERARRYLSLGLPRTLETTGALVDRVTDIELHGLGDDYLARYTTRVEAVDGAAVRDAASRHLRPHAASIVVVGDAGRVRTELEALGSEVRTVAAP